MMFETVGLAEVSTCQKLKKQNKKKKNPIN